MKPVVFVICAGLCWYSCGAASAQELTNEDSERGFFEIRNPLSTPVLVFYHVGDIHKRIPLDGFGRKQVPIAFYSGERAVVMFPAVKTDSGYEVQQPAYVYSIGWWTPQPRWYLTFIHRGIAYGPLTTVQSQLPRDIREGFDKAGEAKSERLKVD